MLSSNKNIEIIGRLILNLRKYGKLRWAKFQLDLIQKISHLFSVLVIAIILFCLFAIAAVLFALMCVSLLRPLLGAPLAYACVSSAFMLSSGVVYLFRRQLILAPLMRFLVRLFLTEESYLHPQQPSHRSDTISHNHE